ncbi:MAG: amidohydrolase family protein [Pyramidobacter sp.]|jgi:dihydroorotase
MADHGDILLQGGHVIDPARNIDGIENVYISHGHCADYNTSKRPDFVFNVSNCIVTPGLIDFHCHFYHQGTEIGVFPDSAFLPQGVTAIVDQGSAGIANFENFYSSCMETTQLHSYAFLNVSPTGLVTTRYMENINPQYFDLDKSAEMLEKYSGRLLGLKIRQSMEIAGNLELQPLIATIRMASKLGCSVAVHSTNPPCSMGKLVNLLRPGDVLCHVFHGKGSHIVDSSGKLIPEIKEARQRGVFFDTADGRAHSCISVIQKALVEGMLPDMISTDQTCGNLYNPVVFGLPVVMSRYLALGMSLYDVVKSCTATPAKFIGQSGKIGTLAPGACGDVAVFRMKQLQWHYKDHRGESLLCKNVLVPMMTLLNGHFAYRSIEL